MLDKRVRLILNIMVKIQSSVLIWRQGSWKPLQNCSIYVYMYICYMLV